jgi:hypothetical protein
LLRYYLLKPEKGVSSIDDTFDVLDHCFKSFTSKWLQEVITFIAWVLFFSFLKNSTRLPAGLARNTAKFLYSITSGVSLSLSSGDWFFLFGRGRSEERSSAIYMVLKKQTLGSIPVRSLLPCLGLQSCSGFQSK